MAVQPQYNTRAGERKFLLLAKTLCRLVNESAPIIRAKFPDRTALLAVLTATELACDLLPAADAEQAALDEMTSDAFDPTDDTVLPGQDA